MKPVFQMLPPPGDLGRLENLGLVHQLLGGSIREKL
jgi:hypothetical protein